MWIKKDMLSVLNICGVVKSKGKTDEIFLARWNPLLHVLKSQCNVWSY